MSGFWQIGMSGFGKSYVSGRNRVPRPAPRTNACVIKAIALKIQHGRRDRLAGQFVAMEKSWRLHSMRALLLAHRTHLYRAGAFSPDERQELRTDDRAAQNHARCV